MSISENFRAYADALRPIDPNKAKVYEECADFLEKREKELNEKQEVDDKGTDKARGE